MPIVLTQSLRAKYKGLPREKSDVNRIVIHGSGSGTAQGIINWMSSDTCERKEDYKKSIGLFPYIIDRDGTVYDILPDEKWYYHSSCGHMDKETIGIELVNPKEKNDGGYTDEQYTSLFKLIMRLIVDYDITSIVGHDYQRAKYSMLPPKPCPNDKFFKWEYLKSFIKVIDKEKKITVIGEEHD